AADAAARAAVAMEKLAAADAPAPAKTEAAPAETKKKEEPAWTGTVGAGFISLTGNANTLTFNATGVAERKSQGWIWAAKGTAIYGQSRPAAGPDAPAEVTALAAALQLRGDRRFTQLVSGYLLTGAETDHVKSVEYRAYGESGVGLLWLDRKRGDLQKLLLRTDLAVRYAEESRFQYYPSPLNVPDLTLIAPRLGVAFRYALTEDVRFFQDTEALLNVVGATRVVVNSTTRLSARLIGALALGTSFLVQYDSQPAPGKVPTDTALSVQLEVGF
ncbi:MAG: DUF481 domain-containing protein, partial [Myxococcales bacterium]